MDLKKIIPHVVAVILFIALPSIYNSPIFSGKVLRSGDLIHGIGNNQELKEYRAENGEEALWNSRLFSGMPSFQMSIQHYGNIGEKLNRFLGNFGKGPISIFFLMSLSFYILLLSFKVNPWLAMAMSFGFTFSSFNVISIEAGHNWKIRTLAYTPGVLAGIIKIYRGKYFLGAGLTALFLNLHLTSNHFQITYYLLLMLLFYGGFKAFESFKNKELKKFFISSAIVVGASIIGFGPTISKLWTTYEYSQETIRGGNSELTLKEAEKDNKSTGLDKDYAMRWSYSPLESFTLIIPHFMGGASGEELGVNSNIAKAGIPKQFLKQIPTYWGEQPFTSGPVYIGAVLFFLFIFGMFILKGNIRWWLLSYSIFVIILSWGRHSSFVSDFMFNYFPLFNKFRTPSMVLLMLSISFPLISALSIQKLIDENPSKKEIFKALKMSAIISLGILLVFGIFGSFSYDFSGSSDAQLRQSGWPMTDLIKDRALMLRSDAYRSILIVILTFLIIYFSFIKKLNKFWLSAIWAGTYTLIIQASNGSNIQAALAIPIMGIIIFSTNDYKKILISLLGILLVADLWMVDKRYLNTDNYVKDREFESIHAPNNADRQILADKDPHFRVFNVTVNPFTDARTSYFHKSLGGYHAAKLLRYQELIENQLSRNNREVINMLNTKYFIVSDQNKQPIAQQNPEANGVGWFVQNIKWMPNANEEMMALNSFNSKTEAIIDERFKETVGELSNQTGNGAVNLTQYDPKHMIYNVSNNDTKDQLVVFSEIYYSGNKDWKAYIDGEYAPHIRVNYVLRAMMIPTGSHKVEFRFEPKSYYTGNNISLAFSVIMILMVLGSLGLEFNKLRKASKD